MLKENISILRKMLIFFNLCLVALAFFLGYAFWGNFQELYPLQDYAGHLPVLIIIWGVLLYFLGMYNSFRIKKIKEILFIVFQAFIFGFLVFSSYLYLFKLQYISRFLIIIVFVFAALLISAEKVALILFFRSTRRHGYNFRNILIVGTGERARYFIDLLGKHAEWGLKIVGLVDEDAAKVGEVIDGCKVLGTFKDMPAIIHDNVIDEVMFVVPRSWLGKIDGMMSVCETEGIKVSIAVDYFNLKFARAKQASVGDFPMLSFESTPDKLWQLFMKRLFDIASSGAGLLLLSPLFAFISLVIKKTSKGPVFFKQERCSLNGRKFTLFKFRTMVEGAEEKLAGLKKHNEMNGPAFKMKDDPRITKMGKFLRKFSLDEFPQLWNVFMGDMSLVGPRPPIPEEVTRYDNWQRRRLSMRPGITCLWQAGGRNKIEDFAEWAKLDLDYIDNWSFWLDIKILFRTVPAVLFARGAK